MFSRGGEGALKKQFSVIRNTRAYDIFNWPGNENRVFNGYRASFFFINRYRGKFLPDAIKLRLIVLGDLPYCGW